tara:strand:- start:1006 stop:1824 length:819 start_codon:yes stop_codon:yes gene_type:complete
MIHSQITENVKNKGFYVVESFLDNNSLKKIEKILKTRILDKKVQKTDLKRYFYRSNSNFLIKKIISLQIYDLLHFFELNKLSKKLKMEEIASEILRNKSKLYSIDSYFSPISQNPVFNWHFDQAYSGKKDITTFENPDDRAIKFFIYFTPVTTDDGCMGYIPKSNLIAYHLKKAFFDGDLQYKPYWMLKDFRNIIQDPEYFSYLNKKLDTVLLQSFIDNTKFIDKAPYETNRFDNTVNKGGAIIFDEGGAHIGSKTTKTERLVLRFLYKPSY